MKTLYISDLDGTLLQQNDRLSKYTIETLNNIIKHEILFSYATARSFSSASVVTNGLEIEIPVIVYNGAFIINPKTGERLVKNSFTRSQIKAVSDFLTSCGIYPFVYSFIDGVERVSWISGTENYGMRHYLNNRKGDKRFREVSNTQDLYTGEVFYFTCIGIHDLLMKVYDKFKSDNSYNAIIQQELYRTEYWCEIMPKNATKANAISELKKLLGCDRIVSFGDAINDLSMFSISDECYAVENAVSELKEKATAIIQSNTADGVAKWLKDKKLQCYR